MEFFGNLSVALDTALLRKSQMISSEIGSPQGDRTPPPTHPFPVIAGGRSRAPGMHALACIRRGIELGASSSAG
jgi:hypothetical protein